MRRRASSCAVVLQHVNVRLRCVIIEFSQRVGTADGIAPSGRVDEVVAETAVDDIVGTNLPGHQVDRFLQPPLDDLLPESPKIPPPSLSHQLFFIIVLLGIFPNVGIMA